jgi:voltage-gated potassium channel
MFGPLRSLLRDPEGKVLIGTAVSTIAIGTVVYVVLEDWSWIDALYFSVVTLATVGFGDLAPTTNEAKLFTVAYIVFGVGIIAAFVSELGKRRTDRTATFANGGDDGVETRVASGAAHRRRRNHASKPTEGRDESTPAGPGSAGPTAV